MKAEEYALWIGRLVVNLQGLEFLLRAYLYSQADEPHVPLAPGVSLDSMAVGDTAAENAFTDFSTLGHLIERYNTRVAGTHSDLTIDHSIVQLRDALAHGRLSAATPDGDPCLLKFERPVAGRARVVFSERLTEAWCTTHLEHIMSAVKKVMTAAGPSVVRVP
jgi:hypothetical protein